MIEKPGAYARVPDGPKPLPIAGPTAALLGAILGLVLIVAMLLGGLVFTIWLVKTIWLAV